MPSDNTWYLPTQHCQGGITQHCSMGDYGKQHQGGNNLLFEREVAEVQKREADNEKKMSLSLLGLVEWLKNKSYMVIGTFLVILIFIVIVLLTSKF